MTKEKYDSMLQWYKSQVKNYLTQAQEYLDKGDIEHYEYLKSEASNYQKRIDQLEQEK